MSDDDSSSADATEPVGSEAVGTEPVDSEPVDSGPVDPGRPAADDAPDSAQLPKGGASTRPDGAGVSIPSWLAGALVVVLALLVASAGFAIGRATAPDDDGFRPVFATEGNGPRGGGGPGGGGSRTIPGPGGRPGELPGFPGGPNGRGGEGDGRRAVPGFPGERDGTYQDDGEQGTDEGPDADQGSDSPAPPELPGT